MNGPTRVQRYKKLKKQLNLVWGDPDAQEILLEKLETLWEEMDDEERDQIETRPVPYTPPPIDSKGE